MSNKFAGLIQENEILKDVDAVLGRYFAGEECDLCLLSDFIAQGLYVIASSKDNPPEINMSNLNKDLHKMADKVLHRYIYSAKRFKQ